MNSSTKSEAAVVKPVKLKDPKLKQSKYPSLPRLSARICFFGRSGSGKSQAMASAKSMAKPMVMAKSTPATTIENMFQGLPLCGGLSSHRPLAIENKKLEK